MRTVVRNIVICASLLVTIVAFAGETPAEELRPVGISAFKNGLAFVVRQGDAQLVNGTGTIAPIPAATLGSLWIAPNDPGTSLDEVIATRTRYTRGRNITSIAELLLANTGKTVTVFDSRQTEYTGEVVSVREADPLGEVPVPQTEFAPRPNPEMLMMRVGGKLIALHLGAIDHVVLPNDPILQTSTYEERKSLRFLVKGATSHANLTMGYLEKGFGWTPSYLISLTDDHTAQITMQAVIVNDAEDVRDADLFFVVGVPNFLYSETPSPMALQQSLLEFMQQAYRRDSFKDMRYSNALMAQKAEAMDAMGAAAPSLAAAVEDLQGASEEDLFMYTRKGVTLAKGERGMYNVFSATVGYEHIYEWEVLDRPRVDAYGNVQNNNYQSEGDNTAQNNVWHSIRLKNATNYPWTSAPATVISGMRPLAQDTLPYSPKRASSNLRLTVAADVRASSKELEVERIRDIQHRRGYNFDQVTVEGTLKVKNYKEKAIKLNVAKTTRGDVISQSDLGKFEKLGEAIAADNPLSRLKWEITLKPGESRVITYRYKVWVRA
jgi:hypothetical protein